MTNEELILQKLAKIEAQIDPVFNTGKRVVELKDDIVPLIHPAVKVLTKELQGLEAGFQMEDVLELVKLLVRNTRNFGTALKQFESVIDFIKDLEPLLKLSVPHLIAYLGELERKGVFRILKATMVDMRAKLADAYGPEDVAQIIDGLVALIGLAKGLSDPKAVEFLTKAATIPGKIDLENAEQVGPYGMAKAAFSPEMKEGFGVMLEMARALGTLKEGNGLDTQAPAAPEKFDA